MNKFIPILITFALFSCSNQRATKIQAMSTEPFIIYKTKADYAQNVPVILNKEKTAIVSYPAPSDLKYNNGMRTPTKLFDGYLLDNRGISVNVAFTSFTYSEYVSLENAPSVKVLFDNIIDANPIIEMYDCKNHIAIKGDLKKTKRLIKNYFEGCKKIK
ncbi:MAG: hypothetical protein JXR50_08385 [Prolixibacteraceae bacterium]|nr:hypothetical protein [Prolixibacteraceae bacterium]MBN2649742.1 hypothetical protein [Prolixibacteraceae bacterium]